MSDLAAVREFVKKQLSSEELVEICHDYFPDVYDEFAPGMASSQRIQLLLDYCQRQGRLDGLLGALRRLQPALYRHYLAPRLTRQLPEEPPPVVDRVRNPRQIFISHAHQDRELAQRLAADLQASGWPVWIAPDSIRPGEKFVEAIGRGLDESGIFVVLLTPAAVASRWVTLETNAAVELETQGEVRFLPILARPCRPPVLWRSYQRISLHGDYPAGLKRLLAELNGEAAEPGERAVEPAGPLAPKQLVAWLKALPAAVWMGGGFVLAVVVLILGLRGLFPPGAVNEDATATALAAAQMPMASHTLAPSPTPTAVATQTHMASRTSTPSHTRAVVPTPTPTTSHTPAPSRMPTVAATSIPSHTPITTPQTTGTLCLAAFEDSNKNGQQDAGEAMRAAVAFTVSDAEKVVTNYVTDGVSEPYCVKGLPAGNYRITRSVAANESLTTTGDWAVAVAAGSEAIFMFGSYTNDAAPAGEEIAAVDTGTAATPAADSSTTETAATESDSGSSLGRILVIAVVIVAVLLLLGVVIITLAEG